MPKIAKSPQAQSTSNCGLLYIAQGRRYLAELLQSARSAKQCMPNLQIAVMTNESDAARKMELFDLILPLDDTPFSWQKRIRALQQSPFERTLFIDTDTYVCGDLEDMFRLLDRFEIGVSHAVIKHSPILNDQKSLYTMPDVPETFPEICCGLLLYKRCEPIFRLFDRWLIEYEAQLRESKLPYHDQPSFGKVAYMSDAKIIIIPAEYQCWFTSGGYLSGRVCVLHGRDKNLPAVAEKLNRYQGPRVFWYSREHLFVYPTSSLGTELLALLSPRRLIAFLRKVFRVC